MLVFSLLSEHAIAIQLNNTDLSKYLQVMEQFVWPADYILRIWLRDEGIPWLW